MKCPKCKYITFDYLNICPRCGKDMSPEKEKLNISSVKPNTPFLLGTLTGDLNDSSVGIKVPESTEEGAEGMMLGDEEVYDDGSELNIDLDEKEISESDVDTEIDIGDIGSSEDDKEIEMDIGSDDISIEVEEEESSSEEGVIQEAVKKEETEKGSEEIELDIEGLNLELDSDEGEDSKE